MSLFLKSKSIKNNFDKKESFNKIFSRFISLKWKAFILSGILLTMIMVGSILAANLYSWSEYEKSQERFSGMMISELHAVIRSHAFQLQKAATRLPYYFSAGHISSDGRPLDHEGSKELWGLKVDYGVIAAYFLYEDELLPSSYFVSQKSYSEVKKYKAPRWDLNCIKKCKITVIVPVIHEEKRGIVILQSLINEAFIEFRNLSRSEILLVSLNSNQFAGRYIDPWKASILGTTLEPTSFGYLEKIAQQKTTLDLESGYTYTVNKDNGRSYYFLSRPFSVSGNQHDLHLIIMRDVSSIVWKMDQATTLGVLFSVGAFIIFQAFILFVLWSPMTRLETIAKSLPLLASNKFNQLRVELGGVSRRAYFLDETDRINTVAVQLSHTLQNLNEQLVQRAHQLELRGIELEAEKDFVSSLLDSAEIIILTQSSDCKIKIINRYGVHLIGKTEREIVNSSFAKLLPQNERLPDLRFQLRELTEGKRNTLQHESDFVLGDGRQMYFAWYHTRLSCRDAHGYDILSIGIDISQRRLAENHLGWLASHDTMTGLLNRRKFNEDFEKILSSSIRYGNKGALFFFDVDQFKDINDFSGHHVGDDLLKKIARALKRQCRDTDIVARFGGDEFVVILIEADRKKAAEIAERICRALEKVEVRGEERVHNATISAGLALFPEHGVTVEELLLNSDLAMYQAKENGRNRWVMYDKNGEKQALVHERVFWNEKVKQVLKDDSFEIYFQPIMSLSTGLISHYESLLRIFDDEGRALPPQKFILSAEKSGLIKNLDFQIIKKALFYKAKLESIGVNISVAINLSGLSFKNENLSLHIEEAIQALNIKDRTAIIFEITETAAVSDFQATIDMMCGIKKLGCKFALDDFGVGFSSLSYLKEFPFDYVKIDGSFIKNIDKDIGDQVMVKAVVEVSKAFGKKTVAEFVENESILSILKTLQVDYVQGYFIDQPKSFQQIWGEKFVG